MEPLGVRIRRAMDLRGISAGELAARLGVSRPAVSQWVSGVKSPTMANLAALAEVLQVRADWLHLGVGTAPAIDPDVRRGEYRPRVKWVFRPEPADGGRDYGNSNIWSFRAGLGDFVREVLQNVIDARTSPQAEAEFKLTTLRGDDRDWFLRALRWQEDLRAHIDAASWNEGKTALFLRDGLDRLERGDDLTLLRVSDNGTTGLVGDEFEPGSFVALTRNNLDSQKAETAGGAFGLGKAVFWRTSRVATVLFNSHLARPTTDGRSANRVFGKAELGWHQHHDTGHRCAGPGWFGQPDPEEDPQRAISYWDNPILADDVHLDRPDGAPGTSILIVGFHDPSGEFESPDEIAGAIAESAAEHFWPALKRGQLRVTVSVEEAGNVLHRVVDPDQAQPGYSALYGDYLDGRVDEVLGVDPGETAMRRVELQVPRRYRSGTDEGHPEFRHEAIVLVRRATDPDDESAGRAAFFRGTGMVVMYHDLRTLTAGGAPFHAAVLTGSAAGDELADAAAERFLRSAEPPAHNAWTSTQELKTEYARGGKSAIDAFVRRVRESIAEMVAPAERDLDEGPRSLKELLRVSVEATPHERKPRVLDAEGSVVDGRWHVAAAIRVKPSPQGWIGRPTVLFNAETGAGTPVEWERVDPVSGCSVAGDFLIIESNTREARFSGVTNRDSHPVPARDSTIQIQFRDARERDA